MRQVALAEYLGVVLMKFDEELRVRTFSEDHRRDLYRALQEAMWKADVWKDVAERARTLEQGDDQG